MLYEVITDLENVLIQKQDSIQGLVLSRSSNMTLFGKVGEKSSDVIGTHFDRSYNFV